MTKYIDKYLFDLKNCCDIGCGVGTISFYVASKGLEVVGYDISSRAINLAKSSSKNLNLLGSCNFVNADIGSENIHDKFDSVICSEVIEHVQNDDDLLAKIYSILNKDGVVIISTPLDSAPLYKWGYLNKFDQDVGHLRRYKVSELIEKIKSNGFTVIEHEEVEGLFRNALYTFKGLGFLVRFARGPIRHVFNAIDKLFGSIFGWSDVYIVCKKT